MIPCLKVNTYCEIQLDDGTIVYGINSCDVEGLEECPRVTAGCVTGEGYELCLPIHAEINALSKIGASIDISDGIATVWHEQNWACGDCQRALVARGIRTFIIGIWEDRPV